MPLLRTFLAALSTVAFAACASSNELPPQAPTPPATSITLWEGGCYFQGSCTTYEMTVQADGAYRLNSRGMTRADGGSEGQLGAEAFAAAERALSAANFATLPERMDGSDRSVWEPEHYPCMIHAPGVRITRRTADGAEKAIYWDQGCSSASMGALVRELRTALHYDELVAR